MKVSLDGGTTWVEAKSGVRVLYDDEIWGGTTLLLNHTEEGVITDVIGASGFVLATDSEMADDIVGRLYTNDFDCGDPKRDDLMDEARDLVAAERAERGDHG